MTILYNDGSNEPGTHVILVGVGRYPFLAGGDAPNPFPRHMGMGQLTSPPHSVAALAHWFLDQASGFHNPDRPLRSLDVLVSSDPPTSINAGSGQIVVAPATMANVRQAILDWSARASLSAGNSAIFYFCGHGLAFGESQNSLLMQDFGGNVANPMADAINFDHMRLGLRAQCNAETQIHLIDACRVPPDSLFQATYGSASTGDTVLAAGFTRLLSRRASPVYFATGLASPAYGVAGSPSLFAQGLLQSMRGPASRDKDPHWEVLIPSLAEGINKCVARLEDQQLPQYCQPYDTGMETTIHRLRSAPEVIVRVATQDENLLGSSVLVASAVAGGFSQSRAPQPAPWFLDLATGYYSFEALTTSHPIAVIGRKERYVLPPSVEVRL